MSPICQVMHPHRGSSAERREAATTISKLVEGNEEDRGQPNSIKQHLPCMILEWNTLCTLYSLARSTNIFFLIPACRQTVPDRLKCCLKIWVRLFLFEESWAWWSKRRIKKVKSRICRSQHFRLVQSCICVNILGIFDTVASPVQSTRAAAFFRKY